MNKQFLTTYGKRAVFALLAISSVGLSIAPAKADDAIIQDSVQESVVTGNDNLSIQNSNQTNQQYSEYRDRGYGRRGHNEYGDNSSTGVVQRSDQYCDQLGEYNTCVQDAQQSNSSYTRRDRRSNRH